MNPWTWWLDEKPKENIDDILEIKIIDNYDPSNISTLIGIIKTTEHFYKRFVVLHETNSLYLIGNHYNLGGIYHVRCGELYWRKITKNNMMVYL